MKRIAIFQVDLAVGGIQRSLINLLNSIDYSKLYVDLYLFTNDKFYEESLPKEVNITYLNKLNKINKIVPFSILKLLYKYRIKKKYDVAIDFNGYSNETALALINCDAEKKVMWIHSDLEQRRKFDFKYRLLFQLTFSKYRYVNEFVAVSVGVKQAFERITNTQKNIVVIPNIILSKDIINLSLEKTDFKVNKKYINFVTMGRLCFAKGFDILLSIMNDIISQNHLIKLYIIGDGPEKKKLEKYINKHNLQNNVYLLGAQKNPFPIMKMMDAFILTSRYEGQGMVVLEAKTLGLPVFITKNLEKYNFGIVGYGYDDIKKEILYFKRQLKKNDLLINYNQKVSDDIMGLLYNK